MIKIKAKKDGDAVELKMNITGTGGDISDEFAAIMLELPSKLCEANPNLFKAATDNFRAQVMGLFKDDDAEVQDELKQN